MIRITGIIGDDAAVYIDGDFLSPSTSLKVASHSPSGFAWGYGGSGPAQLALAILLKYLPVKDALELYQGFKSAAIATLPRRDIDQYLQLRGIVQELTSVKSLVHNS
jgi:hypothetical protein